MAKYASEIVKVAKNWIGKKESDGTFKEIIDLYNSHKPLAQGYKVKYTDEWCATFVSAVSIKLGYTDIIPTECSCQRMIELFKKIGCWIENENRTPNVGDIIFYDWNDSGAGDATGWADHVGIVEKVSAGKITVIEGNYNSKVARRTIEVNAKYIRGYAVPKYDKEVVKNNSNTKTESNVAYFNQYKGSSLSIVDGLKAIGANSSFAYRTQIAAANGINDYCGRGFENTKLLSLLKAGKLIKP